MTKQRLEKAEDLDRIRAEIEEARAVERRARQDAEVLREQLAAAMARASARRLDGEGEAVADPQPCAEDTVGPSADPPRPLCGGGGGLGGTEASSEASIVPATKPNDGSTVSTWTASLTGDAFDQESLTPTSVAEVGGPNTGSQHGARAGMWPNVRQPGHAQHFLPLARFTRIVSPRASGAQRPLASILFSRSAFLVCPSSSPELQGSQAAAKRQPCRGAGASASSLDAVGEGNGGSASSCNAEIGVVHDRSSEFLPSHAECLAIASTGRQSASPRIARFPHLTSRIALVEREASTCLIACGARPPQDETQSAGCRAPREMGSPLIVKNRSYLPGSRPVSPLIVNIVLDPKERQLDRTQTSMPNSARVATTAHAFLAPHHVQHLGLAGSPTAAWQFRVSTPIMSPRSSAEGLPTGFHQPQVVGPVLSLQHQRRADRPASPLMASNIVERDISPKLSLVGFPSLVSTTPVFGRFLPLAASATALNSQEQAVVSPSCRASPASGQSRSPREMPFSARTPPTQVVVLSRSPSLQQAPGCGTPPVPPSFPSLGANTGPFSVGSPRALTPQASNGPLAGGFISPARMRPGHLAHGDRSVQVHSGQPVVGHMSPRTMTQVGFANPHHPAQMHPGQPAAGMISPPRMRSTGSPSSANSGRAQLGTGAQDLHGSVFVKHPRNAEDHALSARTERLQERLGALSALGLTNVRSL